MLAIMVLIGLAGRGAVAAACDPPGPPPRFGCQWSVTDCTWVCAVCDPFGTPPRPSCHWDLDVCNWICPGYTGVDVSVRTLQSPSLSTTVYVALSSLCTSTGVVASCRGHFTVDPGMPASTKCESIVDAIAADCASAGYSVSADDCAASASFITSNIGCPGTPFALGISNNSGVFDQTAAGPLPDGEVESICAPPPALVSDLRLAKANGGLALQIAWRNATDADSYVLFEAQAPDGRFDSVAGTADSGITGLTLDLRPVNEFFLVAGTNSTCGVGPKH